MIVFEFKYEQKSVRFQMSHHIFTNLADVFTQNDLHIEGTHLNFNQSILILIRASIMLCCLSYRKSCLSFIPDTL